MVMTYNHENVISRCLDSLLLQKDYGLNNIIICDDCSIDNTWNVLKEYEEKYPEIVKPHRNEKNLGIYPNMMKLISLRGTADLYCDVAGDDAACDGWFKAVQDYIAKSDVDFSKPMGIYCDWKSINTKGEEQIYKQNAIETGLSLFSLGLRGKICNRSLLTNNMVIDNYWPLVEGKGLNLTESSYDIMPHCIIENAYYLAYVGTIYYTGIGISVELNKFDSPYYKQENIIKWEYFLEHYIKSDKDKYYALYKIESSKFAIKPSISYFCKAIFYFHKSKMKEMRFSLCDYWIAIVPMLGSLRRRLHN